MTISRRVFLVGLSVTALAPQAWAEGGNQPFMLEDVNGAVVDDGTLQGRFSLVFFGYTSCPDVCPTALLTVANTLKLLGGDADKLLPLFITLDPDRDSRKQLASYVANFDSRIVALRGPRPYVDAAARAFDVTYRIVTPDPAHPEDYSVDHTANLFFVGPDGKVIKRFGHDQPAEAIAAEIKAALAAGPGSGGN